MEADDMRQHPDVANITISVSGAPTDHEKGDATVPLSVHQVAQISAAVGIAGILLAAVFVAVYCRHRRGSLSNPISQQGTEETADITNINSTNEVGLSESRDHDERNLPAGLPPLFLGMEKNYPNLAHPPPRSRGRVISMNPCPGDLPGYIPYSYSYDMPSEEDEH